MRRDGRGHERINMRRLRGHAWYHAWGTMRGTMAGVPCYVGFHGGVPTVMGYMMCWDGPHRSGTKNNPRLSVHEPAVRGPAMMSMRAWFINAPRSWFITARRVSRVLCEACQPWGWPRMCLRGWSTRRLLAYRTRVCWRWGRLDWYIRGVPRRLVACLMVVGAVTVVVRQPRPWPSPLPSARPVCG